MKILNLTQHVSTPEQKEAGVVDMDDIDRGTLNLLLTFVEIPTPDRLELKARAIAQLCSTYNIEHAMVGGAPYLMPSLETALYSYGITPMYAFSKRDSAEDPETGRKVSVFRHLGFVRVAE